MVVWNSENEHTSGNNAGHVPMLNWSHFQRYYEILYESTIRPPFPLAPVNALAISLRSCRVMSCLRCLLLLRLECLLAIASYHDDREEAADDGGAKNDQNDRDADGPDTWKKKRVEDMVIVDKWL